MADATRQPNPPTFVDGQEFNAAFANLTLRDQLRALAGLDGPIQLGDDLYIADGAVIWFPETAVNRDIYPGSVYRQGADIRYQILQQLAADEPVAGGSESLAGAYSYFRTVGLGSATAPIVQPRAGIADILAFSEHDNLDEFETEGTGRRWLVGWFVPGFLGRPSVTARLGLSDTTPTGTISRAKLVLLDGGVEVSGGEVGVAAGTEVNLPAVNTPDLSDDLPNRRVLVYVEATNLDTATAALPRNWTFKNLALRGEIQPYLGPDVDLQSYVATRGSQPRSAQRYQAPGTSPQHIRWSGTYNAPAGASVEASQIIDLPGSFTAAHDGSLRLTATQNPGWSPRGGVIPAVLGSEPTTYTKAVSRSGSVPNNTTTWYVRFLDAASATVGWITVDDGEATLQLPAAGVTEPDWDTESFFKTVHVQNVSGLGANNSGDTLVGYGVRSLHYEVVGNRLAYTVQLTADYRSTSSSPVLVPERRVPAGVARWGIVKNGVSRWLASLLGGGHRHFVEPGTWRHRRNAERHHRTACGNVRQRWPGVDLEPVGDHRLDTKRPGLRPASIWPRCSRSRGSGRAKPSGSIPYCRNWRTRSRRNWLQSPSGTGGIGRCAGLAVRCP